MTSKNSVPLYMLLFIGISFFAFKSIKFAPNKLRQTVQIDGTEFPNSEGNTTAIELNKYEKIIRNVMLVLEDLHYSPRTLDDAFSKQLFNSYIEALDYSKDVLLQTDIDNLSKQYGSKIDDELQLKIKTEFFSTAGELYKKKLLEVEPYITEILSKPFSFTQVETVSVDVEKNKPPTTEAERKDVWRKKLKLMTLERYADLQTQNETAKVKKTDAAMEKEAREKVLKIINRSYAGMKRKTNTEDFFNSFMNVVTQAYDPHTDYMPPVEQRSFNEEMSANYFGIGAQLKEEDGSIKIGPLTPGSPAQKSGEINVGDILVAVAQGDKTPEDITGYTTPECVRIIRGKENTEVRLTLKKADGTIKIVKIIRKKLNLEGNLVRSFVTQQDGKKIGVINLPEFYADFENANGHRCARDVAEEIEKLRSENVEGIIMDLRNNGGGSLMDVVQMVGFFIKDGPVVQVKGRDNDINIQKDKDKSVLWDGPLAVMVNEFSASASEIFAAAIQDYGRGVVIGSSSTYGKGTVQRQIPLNFENNKLLETNDYGSIKVTLQKFYRVNGGSTQLKGVTPDIQLPDMYEYLKYRERDNKTALGWDEINKANITSSNLNFDEVKKLSADRVSKNSSFNIIKTNTLLLDKELDKNYSLNYTGYKAEQKTIKDLNKQIENTMKVRDSLPANYLKADTDKYLNTSEDKKANNTQFLKAMTKDIYINEAVKVVADLIKSKALVKQ